MVTPSANRSTTRRDHQRQITSYADLHISPYADNYRWWGMMQRMNWSRAPVGVPSRGEVEGFAWRTRRNLDFILKAHDEHHEEVHVVTQVVLSLLGIVVFPFERMVKEAGGFNIAFEDAAVWGEWVYAEGSERPATLWRLIGHLRHATAHSNIAFSTDSRRLDEVTITFTNQPVGAENSVTSCDLHVLVQKASESVSSKRPAGFQNSASGG